MTAALENPLEGRQSGVHCIIKGCRKQGSHRPEDRVLQGFPSGSEPLLGLGEIVGSIDVEKRTQLRIDRYER